jgi:hypothetical protein
MIAFSLATSQTRTFESRPGLRVPIQSERHVEPVDEKEPVYEYVAERGECGRESRPQPRHGSGEAAGRGPGEGHRPCLDARMAYRHHAQASTMSGASLIAA